MDLALKIPEEFYSKLVASQDAEREALEALAIEAYRTERLTNAELRRVLGFESRFETDEFLKRRDVSEPYTISDLKRERAEFDRLGL